MKNTIILCTAGLLGIIAFSIAFYRLASFVTLEKTYYFVFGLVLVIMIISTLVYFKRLFDELKGGPADDEMTANFSREAAYQSFPYSLSMWVFILVLSMGSTDVVIPVSLEIIGMALLYGGFGLYYKFKGISND